MDAIPCSNWPPAAPAENVRSTDFTTGGPDSFNPVLVIFEDAQWTDHTSLEAVGRVVDRIPTLRVLLLVTFRPEFDPPWIGQPQVTAMMINRLAERDG